MSRSLTLILLSADPDFCARAERAGVRRIMVDLERNGKFERQKCRDTWISKHSFEDIALVARALSNSELMVRINPIYDDTAEEVERAIGEGAQLLMLPMFEHLGEIDELSRMIDGRCRFVPLIETPSAFTIAERVAEHEGVDEVFVGLNDLHLSLGMEFMFEPLANGMLDDACAKFASTGKPYGFGGIARIGEGDLPAEFIVREHARLGSTRVNLSRTFARGERGPDGDGSPFETEIGRLLAVYDEALAASPSEREANRRAVDQRIGDIVFELSDFEG